MSHSSTGCELGWGGLRNTLVTVAIRHRRGQIQFYLAGSGLLLLCCTPGNGTRHCAEVGEPNAPSQGHTLWQERRGHKQPQQRFSLLRYTNTTLYWRQGSGQDRPVIYINTIKTKGFLPSSFPVRSSKKQRLALLAKQTVSSLAVTLMWCWR